MGNDQHFTNNRYCFMPQIRGFKIAADAGIYDCRRSEDLCLKQVAADSLIKDAPDSLIKLICDISGY